MLQILRVVAWGLIGYMLLCVICACLEIVIQQESANELNKLNFPQHPHTYFLDDDDDDDDDFVFPGFPEI